MTMAKCQVCGKGPDFGHNVSHSKRATNRMFKPNIQKHTVYLEGQPRKVYICAACLKTLGKQK
jgi:large subunit ribosomal protein L28